MSNDLTEIDIIVFPIEALQNCDEETQLLVINALIEIGNTIDLTVKGLEELMETQQQESTHA